MTIFRGCSYLSIGAISGALLWSVLRVIQYKVEDLRPNMAPEIFVIIAPVLAIPLAVVACLLHAYFSRWFAYSRGWHWFAAGIAYSTVFLGLVDPWLLLVPLIANPVVVRFVKGVSA
jgi:hypothetical protein